MEKYLIASQKDIIKKRKIVEGLEKEHEELKSRLQELQLKTEIKNCLDLKAVRTAISDLQENVGILGLQMVNIAARMESMEKLLQSPLKPQPGPSNKKQTVESPPASWSMPKKLPPSFSKPKPPKLHLPVYPNPIWGSSPKPTIVLIGGMEQQKMLILSDDRKEWKTLSLDLPESVSKGGAAFLNGEIYIFGGESLGRKTYKLNKGMKWIRVADMNEDRIFISNSSLFFRRSIWTFGGWNMSQKALNSVEKFNPTEGKWEKMPPMRFPRPDAAAAVHGGKVYVCGGCNASGPLASCEFFDPDSNIWTKFAELPSPHYGHAMISDGNSLKILGGDDSKDEFDSVWRMKTNTFNQKCWNWEEEELKMIETRSYLTTATLEGQVYVIGGVWKSSVEVLMENEWKEGPALPEGCYEMLSVVISPFLASVFSYNIEKDNK